MTASIPHPATTSMEQGSVSAPRLHYIDGLRGLAMLMVLLSHCWLFGGQWHLYLSAGIIHCDLATLFGAHLGDRGVNLFLVLSGFCLYWPYVKAGARREPTLVEYARKRCRRILPPYYVVVTLYGAIELAKAMRHHSNMGIGPTGHWMLAHFAMVHNLHPLYVVSINGSLWSLGLEFQLYILFPLLVESFRRFRPRPVLLLLLLVTSLYRLWLARGGYLPQYEYEYVLANSVFGRCFEFALGMFAAELVSRRNTEARPPLRRADVAGALILGALFLLDLRHNVPPALSDAGYGLLFATMLVAASRPNSWLQRCLSAPPIVWAGVISYSVYLIHLPLVMSCGTFVMRHHLSNAATIAVMILVAPAMILLGYLFHLVFERPFMNLPRGPSGDTGGVLHVKST